MTTVGISGEGKAVRISTTGHRNKKC